MKGRLPVGRALALGLLISIPSWSLSFLWISSITREPPLGLLMRSLVLLSFGIVGAVASSLLGWRWSRSPWWLRVLPGLAAGGVGTGIFWAVFGGRGAFLNALPAFLGSLVSIHLLPPLSVFPPLFLLMMGIAGGAVAWLVLDPVRRD